jgi:protein TonB
MNNKTARTPGEKYFTLIALLLAILLHGILLARGTLFIREERISEDRTVFKLVDVEEYRPPTKSNVTAEPHPRQPEEQEFRTIRQPLPGAALKPIDPLAETIEETDKHIQEIFDSGSNLSLTPSNPGQTSIEYLPPHKISVPPKIPVEQVLQNLSYPLSAKRQRIEGVVYLELYIDQEGTIQQIVVLKDPGYGFSEAAIKAFEGVRCIPAEANGVPVPVRYRYPIRFKLR